MAKKRTSKEPKGNQGSVSKERRKVPVFSLNGNSKATVDLPKIFSTEYRPDLILRAFVSEQSWERQPYGTDPMAGLRTTAEYYGRRREYYRLTVNRGISRLPREKRPGGGLGHVKQVPQARGGRRAHPPKAEKKWGKKINLKEWIKALKSAIAATANIDLIKGEGRSHVLKEVSPPLVVEDAFEHLKKTREIEAIFDKLHLSEDLERAKEKKIKAGRSRGGKKRTRKSVLIVFSKDCDAMRAAANLPGVDVSTVADLMVSLLAPGGHPGRLTLWTEGALKKLDSLMENAAIEK